MCYARDEEWGLGFLNFFDFEEWSSHLIRSFHLTKKSILCLFFARFADMI